MRLPEEFINKMKKMLNEDFENFLKSYNYQSNHSLRLNTFKNIDFLRQEFNNPVEWCKNAYYYNENTPFGKSIFHNMGLYYIQESSAMFPVEALSPQENEIILDLCAAPGGKSTQIALKMNNTGLLISNEIITKRASILKDNIARMGIKNTIILNESSENISKRFNNYFDKILVDAPCSGEGMFRKNPEAINEWSLQNVEFCAERQLNILNTIKNCLKDNGVLVYSTCTFSPEENEQVIEKFLEENKDFSLINLSENNFNFSGGIIKNTKNNLKEITKTVRIFPHKTNGEGHFIAKLQKLSNNNDIYNIKLQKSMINNNHLKLIKTFEKENLTNELKGTFVQFGDNIYLCPHNTPNLDKIKVVYSGVLLGKINNNRFEPSYEFALSLTHNDVKNYIKLTDDEVKKYIHGETINTNQLNGWVLITYKNNPLSWGKISNNTIKNYYPKYLRK